MIPSWSLSPLNIACLVLSVGCKSKLFTNILYFFLLFQYIKMQLHNLAPFIIYETNSNDNLDIRIKMIYL